jgi:hypothetical protein
MVKGYEKLSMSIRAYEVNDIVRSEQTAQNVNRLRGIVNDVLRAHGVKNGSYPLIVEPLIIERFGYALQQGAWTDTHGVGVIYRVPPLDTRFAYTRANDGLTLPERFAQEFLRSFASSLGGSNSVLSENPEDPGSSTAIVAWERPSSIGD